MRDDLRVVVSSATINAEVFSQYFDNCPVVRIDAQMYPVTMVYDPPLVEDSYDDLLYKIGEIVDRIMEEEREGDILIFLSGERMIKDCIELLRISQFRRKLHLLPLYGRLSKEEQERVFDPAPDGKTKVVVSTNIAETSVTIDGITSVIDSGLAKMNYYNPRTYTESLIEGPISKASANQRRGRAGRTRPGTCYRLYPKDDYETRRLFTLEEIYRTDLSEVVLRMAEIGIRDFDAFDFISSPGRESILAAVETLFLLDALTEKNELSEIGRMMARFLLLPRHSRIIVEAIRVYPDVVEEVLVATAFLSSRHPFLLPQGEEIAARKAHHRYRDDLGDFVSYLRLYDAYRSAPDKESFCDKRYLDPRVMGEIHNIKTQLEVIVSDMGIPIGHGGTRPDYLCAVSKGLIQFVCVRTGRGTYRSLTAERILIHPGSVMFQENPEYIVAGEIVRTSRMYARSVSPLYRQWLGVISPELSRELRPKGGGKTQKQKEKKRDTTWQVKIGNYSFPLKPHKGKKKIATLPWQELKKAMAQPGYVNLPQYGGLKGTITYGDLQILSGTKLSTLLEIAGHIDPDRDLRGEWPRKKTFTSEDGARELVDHMDYVMAMARVKKSSTAVGFLSLNTNQSGEYWFRVMRNFYTAATDSMASLEVLVDEVGDTSAVDIAPVNEAYRRLAHILEEE
jgi:HrpA-like RNA helicase